MLMIAIKEQLEFIREECLGNNRILDDKEKENNSMIKEKLQEKYKD